MVSKFAKSANITPKLFQKNYSKTVLKNEEFVAVWLFPFEIM
jgi:hypothetical protein